MNFFAGLAESAQPEVQPRLPNVPPWEKDRTLAAEKEVLGFHVSGHPLDAHEQTLQRFGVTDIRAAAELADRTEVRIGAQLANVRPRVVNRGKWAGQKMATATLHDKTGSIGAVIFSEPFARHRDAIANDAVVAVTGKVDHARGEPCVVVDRVLVIDELDRHLAARIELELIDRPPAGDLEATMETVESVLRRAAGAANGGRSVEIVLHLETRGKRVALKPHRLRVIPEANLIRTLRDVVGPDHVRVIDRG